MKKALPQASGSEERVDALFQNLVTQVKEMNNNEISEQEALEATHHWLSFCSKLIAFSEDEKE
jgi:hypothetical protein